MHNIKILVVDDDALYRETISAILTREGYDVMIASEGEEGLDALKVQQPRILITDILMPNKEGLELIHEIRQAQSDIKILAISGSGYVGHSSFLEMARAFGANDILKKPFKAGELLKKIQDLCEAV